MHVLSSYTSVLRLPQCNSSHRTADIAVQLAPPLRGVFRRRMPPAATPDPRLLLSTAWTEMGDHRPSPAPPCPHTPSPGLAAFRTSPSLDWVSPVAPAENTVWGTAVPFLFLSDFSSILPLSCTLGFYSLLSGPPHCDLTVCLYLVSAQLLPRSPQPLYYSPCTAPASRNVIASAIPLQSP